MNFISIRLSTIRPELIVPFDIYIKVGDKFFRYLNKNDEFDITRLDRLRKKGVKKFHINSSDESSYESFLGQQLENIHLSPDTAKTSLALDVSGNSADMILKDANNEKSYTMATFSSDILKKVVANSDTILRGIVTQSRGSSSDLPTKMQSHLVNTVSISIKFADELKSNINLNALGIAAFYHDSSFSQFSPQDQKLFFKDQKEMNAQELSIYKTHPEKSVTGLQDKPFADKEVLELIMTHEEKISGQGFPKKLTKLTLAQEVLSLCAFYDREVTCIGKDPQAVLDAIMIEQVGNYNLELLKKFKTFLKKYL